VLRIETASPVHARRSVVGAALIAVLTILLIACGDAQIPDDGPVAERAARPLTSLEVKIAADAETVIYGPDGFSPPRLDIATGQQVRFVNESDLEFWPASNIHPTHQIYPELDAKAAIPPGQSWVFTFDRSGFWRYHNHLSANESGLIVVSGGFDAQPLVLNDGEVKFDDPPSLSLGDLVALFQDDPMLFRFTELYGPARTVELLSEAEGYAKVDCHQRAHEVGRKAYDLFGATAFSLASHECHAGSYHGATEALFRDRGVADLQEDVAVLCGNTQSPFFRHQCVHGVGHGLMAWTSYELLDALPMCDRLIGNDQLSCYSGIFMENVVGGLSGNMGHYTAYLSDDPHFPCNAIEDKYLSHCYFYQTSRMVVLFEGGYDRVAQACAEAPSEAVSTCFASYGRDVGGVTRQDPARAIELCGHADDPEHRILCLEGAAQDRFWDVSGADAAITMCEMLEDGPARERCNWTIVHRAFQIYPTRDGFREFCGRIEEQYRFMCDQVSS
jgi:plastocyanin